VRRVLLTAVRRSILRAAFFADVVLAMKSPFLINLTGSDAISTSAQTRHLQIAGLAWFNLRKEQTKAAAIMKSRFCPVL